MIQQLIIDEFYSILFSKFFLIIDERYLLLKMRASAQLLTNEHQLM